MKFLMLVCVDSDFSPPDTIGEQTERWVSRADGEGGRTEGGRLVSPEEAVVLGPDGDDVAAVVGARTDADEQVVGFDVLDCRDLEHAVDLVRAHPMALAGRIELRQLWAGSVEDDGS